MMLEQCCAVQKPASRNVIARSNSNSNESHLSPDTSCNRRQLHLAAVASAAAPALLSNAEAAEVASAPRPSLADVTPKVQPRGSLRDSEQAIIDVFDSATRSVVNIFDLSLQGRNPQVQVADVPEGNGSGFIWSTEGHIVTNYHVLANILNNVNPAALARKDFKVCLHAQTPIPARCGKQQASTHLSPIRHWQAHPYAALTASSIAETPAVCAGREGDPARPRRRQA